MEQLLQAAPELVADGADARLPERIDAVLAEVAKPAPDRSRLQRLLGFVRDALTNAAGNALATGAVTAIERVLELL